MANEFSHNKKTKLIAASVVDAMDYVKASHSYMSQGELEGKKYGKTYNIYIPVAGEVKEGLVADPSDVKEVEVTATLDNRNISVNLDAWNKLTDIEDFAKEIAKPNGTKLGLSVQNEIIKKTFKDSLGATVVSASDKASNNWGFKALSEANGKLIESGVAGDKVSFLSPTLLGAISASGLANFIPDSIQKEIYGKNYLGEYAGSSVIGINGLPTIKVASIGSATVTDTDGKYEVSGATEGVPYTLSGLKMIDVNGIKTDKDIVFIGGSSVKLEEGVNCYKEGEGDITATAMIEANKAYKVGIVRTKEALGYDTYKFADLPGSENSTQSVDGVSIKMSQYGNGQNMEVLVRLDCPFCAVVPDARAQELIFVEA